MLSTTLTTPKAISLRITVHRSFPFFFFGTNTVLRGGGGWIAISKVYVGPREYKFIVSFQN
jgi:hypothetical protein